MDSPKAVPSLALAAYSEDLVTGRRVVIFGNALSGLAETLVERGARLVHVYDENPTRVAEAAARNTSSTISFAPLSPGGIAARDGAFDVGFVEELAAFSDPGQLITKLRRALSARGVGLVSTANVDVSPYWATEAPSGRSALSYYELYDVISTHFDEVRMVGQTPFVGYALADFSPDSEGEFSIDTGFVPGGAEEPERYIAVCSHFPVAVEPFCVVQMQASEVLSRPTLEAQASRGSAAGAVAELAELRRELASERAAKVKLEQLLRNVNDELVRRDEWVQELESRAATADERADAAEAELERLQRAPVVLESNEVTQATDENSAELARLTAELDERSREVEAQRRTIEQLRLEIAQSKQSSAERVQRVTDLEKRVEELEQRLTQAEAAKANALEAQAAAQAHATELSERLGEADRLQSELTELQATVSDLRAQMGGLRSDLHLANDEIARAEQQLAEQGQTVLSLRADLAETERFAALLLAERDAENAEPKAPESAERETFAPVEENVADPNFAVTDDEPVSSERPLASEPPPDSLEVERPTQREISSNSHSIPPAPEGRQALEQARARQAELEAALQETRWTVEELENRLAERSNEPELLERLYRAERQLQRQATLIEQYERNVRSAPSSEEPTL
jgi:predicted nuclease with TOPRIM domain